MAFKLLDKKEESLIVKAIAEAEKSTSGEIRVHIEKNCIIDPVEAASKVFENLGMCNTRDRNGVLIYIAYEARKLAIIGDKGINDKVGHYFWDSTRDLLVAHFSKGAFAEGIAKAVVHAGEQLKRYFPIKHDDTNELSNQITYSS